MLLCFRFVGDLYTPLEPYFVADPLLLYDFVYLCPEDDYQVLFGKIPAHLSLTWLSLYRPLPFVYNHVRDVFQFRYTHLHNSIHVIV